MPRKRPRQHATSARRRSRSTTCSSSDSGGGNNAWHLRRHFTMTLVDRSEEMLAVSRRLNPGCEHVAGDMRDVRLGRTFDAVFVHDAVAYMLDRDRPTGGDGDGVRALPSRRHRPVHPRRDDRVVRARHRSRRSTTVTTDGPCATSSGAGTPIPPTRGRRRTTCSCCATPTAASTPSPTRTASACSVVTVWLRLLAEVGFDAEVVTEETTEDRRPRDLFIGRRPP